MLITPYWIKGGVHEVQTQCNCMHTPHRSDGCETSIQKNYKITRASAGLCQFRYFVLVLCWSLQVYAGFCCFRYFGLVLCWSLLVSAGFAVLCWFCAALSPALCRFGCFVRVLGWSRLVSLRFACFCDGFGLVSLRFVKLCVVLGLSRRGFQFGLGLR